MFAYEKLTFCSQRVESEETGYRAALLNSGLGRPSYQISREQLVYFLRERFSRREVSHVQNTVDMTQVEKYFQQLVRADKLSRLDRRSCRVETASH